MIRVVPDVSGFGGRREDIGFHHQGDAIVGALPNGTASGRSTVLVSCEREGKNYIIEMTMREFVGAARTLCHMCPDEFGEDGLPKDSFQRDPMPIAKLMGEKALHLQIRDDDPEVEEKIEHMAGVVRAMCPRQEGQAGAVRMNLALTLEPVIVDEHGV